jgi:glycosyltransferase involved in cell wall biosynthesis
VIPLAAEPAAVPDRGALLARFPELASSPWLLFLSRLDRKKNVELLLQALAMAPAGFPRCLIAGDGDELYVRELHAFAASLGVGPRVTWAGHLDGGQKSAALDGASVFVLPSASENFGISVVEALQAGLPVVAARGVAIAKAVEDRGAGACIDAEPSAILAAVSRLLGDETQRQQCADNARRLAKEEYSLAALGSRLQLLYETILGSPERRLSHAY